MIGWAFIANTHRSKNYPKISEVWTNAETLSTIGFACGKLAETSSIPWDIRQDEGKKKNFLKQQAQYRKETEFVRRRCLELSPNNATYLTSMAYLYYQNVLELNAQGGRRDGDIREEIKQALEWLDRTLEVNPNRITDLYRKGRLLTDILPKQILFGRSLESETNKPAVANETRQQGIRILERVVGIWQSLPEDHWERKRYRKEYIKSLYQLGNAYYDMIFNTWDEAIFAFHLDEGIPERMQPPSFAYEIDKGKKSHEYFMRCWQADKPNDLYLDETTLNRTPSEGVEEGVHRLYWLGKTAFSLYWLSSGYGQVETDEALIWQEKAEQYLTAALNLPWSSQKQRQKKGFIAELLARFYITKKQPQKSVRIVDQQQIRKPEAYIQQTYALALLLMGEREKALQTLLNIANDRQNKAKWTTQLLIGCTLLEENSLKEAEEAFTRAQKEAHAQGKEAIDSALIGRAFVSYKSQNRGTGIKYLEQARELNPNRLAVHKRLQDWKAQEMLEQSNNEMKKG